MTHQDSGFTTASSPVHLVTHDTEVIDHWISHDQLMILARGGKDKSFDVCLAAIGAALGFSQNFFSLFSDLYNARVPAYWTVIGTIVFASAVTTIILAGLSHSATKQSIDALVAKIQARNRSRMPMREGALSSSGENAAPSA